MRNLWKNILIGLALCGFVFAMVPEVYAQATILPKTDDKDCVTTINKANEQLAKKPDGKIDSSITDNVSNLLGCAVATGRVSLWMLPYFIQYFCNYLLGMVSLISLLFVVIGGVMYTVGEAIEKKGAGVTYIKNALIGMATAFLAWSIVSVILAAVTG